MFFPAEAQTAPRAVATDGWTSFSEVRTKPTSSVMSGSTRGCTSALIRYTMIETRLMLHQFAETNSCSCPDRRRDRIRRRFDKRSCQLRVERSDQCRDLFQQNSERRETANQQTSEAVHLDTHMADLICGAML